MGRGTLKKGALEGRDSKKGTLSKEGTPHQRKWPTDGRFGGGHPPGLLALAERGSREEGFLGEKALGRKGPMDVAVRLGTAVLEEEDVAGKDTKCIGEKQLSHL